MAFYTQIIKNVYYKINSLC